MIDIVDLFNACLYIQDHLDADLSLLFLAQTVGLSRFRFHRVFKAWRGETLHDFVTRMRMERAAFELSYPIPRSSRRSIKAIAFASGYKSLSSFSHAFSSYSNLSPREFRNRALRRRPGVGPVDASRASFGPYAIRVSHQPERHIAVLDPAVLPRDGLNLSALARLATAAPVAGERYGVELLPNLLARARGEGNLSAKVNRLSCVGVTIDDWLESARQMRTGRTAPRTAIRLDAGRYAVLEGSGSVAALYRAWRRGFDAWLAASGECPKPGRLYVRFGSTTATPDAPQAIALFIPLEDLPVALSRPTTRQRSRAEAAVSLS
jgi:AraC-like DNA-binding protein